MKEGLLGVGSSECLAGQSDKFKEDVVGQLESGSPCPWANIYRDNVINSKRTQWDNLKVGLLAHGPTVTGKM